jgi:molybdate transport system substrate-binding protein
MKKIFITLLLALNISLQAQTVKIAAAANLRYILEEIKTNYCHVNPGTDIILNFGSSGTFYQQIINGADYNIFMAADRIYPDRLKSQGVVSGDVKTYAFGKLVLWSNSIDVSKGLDILTDKSVNRIAIANPELAPYGERSVQCLKFYNLFEKIKDKIVYADNIAQAAQFAQTGNAEAGFIALALAMSPEMKGTYFVIDTKSYKPVEQAMVLIKNGQTNPEAVKFMNYIMSAECKPVFEKYGFILP